MITWSQQFETGHPSIDSDHRKLVDSLNALETALQGGAGKERIGEMIGFLNQYARVHFAREEQHMRTVSCPAFGENCAEHRRFVARLDGWLQQLGSDPSTTLVLEVHRETSAWIRSHILKTDCQLRGCRPSAT